MKLTLWVCPGGQGQYLVNEWKDKANNQKLEISDVIDNYFVDLDYLENHEGIDYSDKIENITKEIMSKKEEWQYYDELDTEKHFTVSLGDYNGYEEFMDFIWVMMSENDLKSLSDFGGW